MRAFFVLCILITAVGCAGKIDSKDQELLLEKIGSALSLHEEKTEQWDAVGNREKGALYFGKYHGNEFREELSDLYFDMDALHSKLEFEAYKSSLADIKKDITQMVTDKAAKWKLETAADRSLKALEKEKLVSDLGENLGKIYKETLEELRAKIEEL